MVYVCYELQKHVECTFILLCGIVNCNMHLSDAFTLPKQNKTVNVDCVSPELSLQGPFTISQCLFYLRFGGKEKKHQLSY